MHSLNTSSGGFRGVLAGAEEPTIPHIEFFCYCKLTYLDICRYHVEVVGAVPKSWRMGQVPQGIKSCSILKGGKCSNICISMFNSITNYNWHGAPIKVSSYHGTKICRTKPINCRLLSKNRLNLFLLRSSS